MANYLNPEEDMQDNDPLAGLNELVANHMRQKLADYDQAKQANDSANKIGAVGDAVAAVSNAASPNVVLANSWQNMGKAPSVMQGQHFVNPAAGLREQAAQSFHVAGQEKDRILQEAMAAKKAEMMQKIQAQKAAEEANRWNTTATETARHNRATEANSQTNAEALSALRQQNVEAKLADKQAKADKETSELNVPGYSRTGEVTQTTNEAQKTRDAIGVANSIKQGLEVLKNQVKENGNFEWGGSEGAAMDATATDLRLQLKELANLGVLSGPDYMLMLKQIPDTTSLGQFFTRNSTTGGQLDAVMDNINRKVAASMKAKGYTPSAQENTAPKAPRDYESMTNAQLEALLKGN